MSLTRSPSPTCASMSLAAFIAATLGEPLMSIGTETFSAMVSVGMRLKAWKTKPTLRPRKEVLASDRMREKSSPSTVHSPPSRSSTPAMTEMSVVFPQPEGPTSMSSSPERTSMSTPRRAFTAELPLP